MKLLTQKQVEQLLAESKVALDGGNDTWNTWEDAHGCKDATVEFPLGELMNEGITGFLWAWDKQGRIELCDIGKGDRFNAQGLEGKCQVATTLATALLVWRELPAYRCQIRA